MDHPIHVLAYAGSRADERPRAVWRGETAVAVTDVLWGWIETGADPGRARRRWFRVRLASGDELTLYHDEALDAWFVPEVDPIPPEAPPGETKP